MEHYDSSTKRDLYLCQLFGFTPRAFIDFFYNVLSREIGDALTEIETQIKEEPLLSKGATEADVKKGSKKLLQLCDENIAKNIDRLELYLKNNIFRIPDNVVLPGDQIQEYQCSYQENETNLDIQIEQVENQIKASSYSSLNLQKELGNATKLEEKAEQLLGTMAFCRDSSVHLNDENIMSLCKDAKECIGIVKHALSFNLPYEENLGLDKSISHSVRKKKRT